MPDLEPRNHHEIEYFFVTAISGGREYQLRGIHPYHSPEGLRRGLRPSALPRAIPHQRDKFLIQPVLREAIPSAGTQRLHAGFLPVVGA